MATYPGDYAVPGLIWPGFLLPGEPVTASSPPPPSASPVPPASVSLIPVLTAMGVA